MAKYIVGLLEEGRVKPVGDKTVHPMVFPIVTYENKIIFDSIKYSL